MKTHPPLCPLPWKILPTVATGKVVIGCRSNLVTEDICQMLPPKPHASVARNCELMRNHAMMIVHAVNNYERLSDYARRVFEHAAQLNAMYGQQAPMSAGFVALANEGHELSLIPNPAAPAGTPMAHSCE